MPVAKAAMPAKLSSEERHIVHASYRAGRKRQKQRP